MTASGKNMIRGKLVLEGAQISRKSGRQVTSFERPTRPVLPEGVKGLD